MLREAGLAAVQERRWREASDQLAELAANGQADAGALDALADAQHAIGDYESSVHARQEAHAAYLEAGDRAGAAATAVKLANAFFRRGELAVTAGWAATAERLLLEKPECEAHGLVAWVKATFAILVDRDLEAAEQLADETTAIGDRLGDRDLQALALMLHADVRAKSGQAAAAVALLDEAMARAVGVGLSPWVGCHVLCRSLIVCQDLGDVRRAKQWTAAARAACDREGVMPLSGDCRVHHACLLSQQGEWFAAEQEAQTGCEELPDDVLHLGIASYELGEIALRRGDLGTAAAAFERAHELGQSPQPGLALLRLAQGNARAAAAMISEALDDDTFPFRRALLLAAHVEITLAGGDTETGRRAARELAGLEASLDAESVAAFSDTAHGAVALSDGEHDEARARLKRGARRWTQIGMPYRAARARMLLAEACLASDDLDAAALELKTARSTFEKLGAQPDARRAARLLRTIARDPQAETPSQRVTRAFMFTDIVGSTQLVEALGDDAWADLRHWHDACLRAEFAAHHGQEVDHAGDGFFVAFATAAEALECAASIQAKLREHRRASGFAPQVRIGVHVDDASTTDEGYLGRGVHTAARIGAQAAGGEILVSRAVATAAGDAFDLGESRTVSLKGIDEPVEILAFAWQ